MNLITKLTRSMQNLLLILLTSMLVAACGSSSDVEPSRTAAEGNGVTMGTVFGEQGPVANAAVIVKSREGHVLGSAVTNAQGQFKVASTQSGLFMAEAKESTGKVWYGMSLNGNMNVTHLGDWIIRLWYQAKGLDVSKIFAGLDASAPMPVLQELTVAANQILSVPANALGKGSIDLFGSELTPTLAKILQGTHIQPEGAISIKVPEAKFNGTYKIKSKLSKQGDVVFKGSEETESANVPLTKGPIEVNVGSVQSSGTTKRQLKRSGYGSNEHWMKDNWEFVKDKKLSELVIPGTHDSGTYQIYGLVAVDTPIAQNTAKTQTGSIGTQLKDGIRYIDLRVREARHSDCADPSVWWINHGNEWYSYRLQSALDEVKAFLAKPENENEVIILDLQATSTRYDDDRARDVLLAMIQDKLKGFLAKNEGDWRWQNATMSELVKNNKRAIVLLENNLYEKIKEPDFKPGCGVSKIDYQNFANRTVDQISHYVEYSNVDDIKKLIVDAQLNSKASQSSGNKVLFAQYDTATRAGKLRVLQLVTRPSNLWYVASGALAITPIIGSGYPNDLLSYATLAINSQLNYKVPTNPITIAGQSISVAFGGDYKDYLAESGCQSGWLGKRLRMGIQGESDQWNAPNIIIVDNYVPQRARAGSEYAWVLPDFKNGQWVMDKATGFVDMIISLNRISREDRPLREVTDMQDGQCLQ